MPLRTGLGMNPLSTTGLATSTLASVASLPVTGWALTTRTARYLCVVSSLPQGHLKRSCTYRFRRDAGHDVSVDLLPAGSRTAVPAAT